MNTEFTHIVPENTEKKRIQEYAVGLFDAAWTKSALKKAIKRCWVKVNGNIALTGTFISGGETITFSIPEPKEPERKLILPLTVLFEDEYLALVHKRAGILVSGNSFFTIANALEQNLQKSTSSDACTPQPIHRLDYPTTGILLIGKTNSAIRSLYGMFEKKKINKAYLAITIGDMSGEGEINTEVDGKKALTKYAVLNSVSSERFGQLNLVKLDPQTGRRHQIRIHMASLGCPILGDKEYGKEPLILNGKGLYLHAYSLSFVHPVTNVEISKTDQKVDRFQKIFDEFDWE